MTDPAPCDLVLDYDLDAPPQKVWRAIAIADIRRKWLPAGALADPLPIEVIAERELRYRMREPVPPFLESVVRFQISPNGSGGTHLRVVHELALPRRISVHRAMNANIMSLARAA